MNTYLKLLRGKIAKRLKLSWSNPETLEVKNGKGATRELPSPSATVTGSNVLPDGRPSDIPTAGRFTREYSFKNKQKVFFVANSGMCNLNCRYCFANNPRFKESLNKDDFSFIFDYFGENIYFVFSGVGDFFCGYSEEDQLLRFLLRHNVTIFLDINGVDIKELADKDLEGRDKIDMLDISYHFGTMKKEKLLHRWVDSIQRIQEGGYNYHIKMVSSPLEKEIWEEAFLFYSKEVQPITRKKLLLFPDTNVSIDLKDQLNELEKMVVNHKYALNIHARESLFKKTTYPSGMAPPCPAGSRFFWVWNTGEIVSCLNRRIPLGNVREKDVITLTEDIPCNLTGFFECGWATSPRATILNSQNELYARRTFYEYESKFQELPLPEETDHITLSIDRLEEDAQIVKNLRIEGWAFMDGVRMDEHNCCIVLKSEKNTYIFDTCKRNRPDALSPFDSVNPYDSGFFAFIPKGNLEAGEYNVGVYIGKTATGQEGLRYSGRRITIDRFSGFSILN